MFTTTTASLRMPPRRTVARPVREAGPPPPVQIFQQPMMYASTSAQPYPQMWPAQNVMPPQPGPAYYPPVNYAQPYQHAQPQFYNYSYPQQQYWNGYSQHQQASWPQPSNSLPNPPAQASTSVPARPAAPPKPQEDKQPIRQRRPPAECQPCRKRFSSVVQLIAHQHQHVKCTEANCSFEGDQHAVTIHKQDRHLIFPPGYQHKRRKQPRAEEDQEGDEDEEAAMAKRFANAPQIEGTSIKLDSPEAIKAWIEERKKKWPTNQRVEEKNALEATRPAGHNNNKRGRKGQQGHQAQYSQPLNLPVNPVQTQGHPNKKRRFDNNNNSSSKMQRQSNQNTRSGPPGQLPETPSTISSTDKADHELDGTIVFEPAPSSDQDDDAPVEEMTSKAPPQRDETRPVVGEGDTRLQGDSHKSDRATSAVASSEEEDSGSESSSSDSDTSSSDSSSSQEEEEAAPGKADRPAANRRSRDPQNKAESENTMLRQSEDNTRKPVHGSKRFISVSQKNLLGRLLEHDIAHEMSDLVQVAEFLVRNQFLKDVELTPGDADQQMIQEIA